MPGKRRISALIESTAVCRRSASPFLVETLPYASTPWAAALCSLANDLTAREVEARAFGSLAWQYFAADPSIIYFTPESDVDLLLRPARWACAQNALDALESFASRHPAAPRLDGEILLPGGEGVAWRELRGRPAKVLVKGREVVELRRYEDIRALFNERAA
jgi:phosphoribosyl-dephospho-CoA transferase